MSAEHENPNRDEQVVNLLRAAARSERAPESLRTQVAAMRAQAATRRRRPTLQPVYRFVSAGTAAVAGVVVALVLTLGGAGAPSIAQAAALANLRPTAGARPPT